MDFDSSIEEKIKDHFMEDYIFSIDICIPLYNISHETITKYGNCLLSSKKGIVNISYDVNVINEFKSFSTILSKILICSKIYNVFKYDSHPIIKSSCVSIGSLIYYLTLQNKIFSFNGLKDKNFRLVNKLPKGYDIYKNYDTMMITYETNVNYLFVYMIELVTFPPTKNFKKVINRLDLTKKYFILRWFELLCIALDDTIIQYALNKLKITKIEFMSINVFFDEYNIIKIFKSFLGHIRSKVCNTTCPICLDEYTMFSPLHFCSKGHISHLCCSTEPIREYLISGLRNINNNNMSEFNKRYTKCCGICRTDYYDLIYEGPHANHEFFINRETGIARFNDMNKYFELKKSKGLIDIKLMKPYKKVGINLKKGSMRKYMKERYDYLLNK